MEIHNKRLSLAHLLQLNVAEGTVASCKQASCETNEGRICRVISSLFSDVPFEWILTKLPSCKTICLWGQQHLGETQMNVASFSKKLSLPQRHPSSKFMFTAILLEGEITIYKDNLMLIVYSFNPSMMLKPNVVK